MKTHKSIYETPLVLVEAFSTELGFAESTGNRGNGIPNITSDYVVNQSDDWN